MKYFIKIYGCQYNEWDGAKVDYLLQKLGMIPSTEKEADIIFILSCSVRKSAVDRVMSTVKNNSKKKVIVTGCILEDDKKKYEKKKVLLWNISRPEDLLEMLGVSKQFSNKAAQQFINEGNITSTYLPIIIGCNNFCSYCAVPYVRGREQSRDFDEIVNDFKKLIKKGYKEIILLGQNVNSYGKNNELRIMNYELVRAQEVILSKAKNLEESHSNFSVLLRTLNDIPGDFVIRFTSNHPKDMTDDIIAAIKNLSKVKKEIHLPFQSGSNKVLQAMNRPYTKGKYLELIEKLKKEIPDIKITTDVIVGFPGETEEDFQETVDVFKKVRFSQSFTNKYSPRSGTKAFELGDPIPWKEKQRRWRIINDIVNKK